MSEPLRAVASVLETEALERELGASYDLARPVTCTLLSAGVNDTYLVTADGHPFVLRVYRAGLRARPEVEYELDLLLHLGRRGVPVSTPVQRRDGGWLAELAAPEGWRPAVLFSYAPGKVLTYSEEDGRLYGRAAAELHGAAEGFHSSAGRAALDVRFLLQGPLQALRPVAERRGLWVKISEAARELEDRLAALIPGLTAGICHGDLHGHNVHRDDEGRLTFIDFDFCGPGWTAYDLATFRWAVDLHSADPKPWESFLEGYRQVRPLSEADLAAIPLLVGMRTVWLMGLRSREAAWQGVQMADRVIDWGAGHLSGWMERGLTT